MQVLYEEEKTRTVERYGKEHVYQDHDKQYHVDFKKKAEIIENGGGCCVLVVWVSAWFNRFPFFFTAGGSVAILAQPIT